MPHCIEGKVGVYMTIIASATLGTLALGYKYWGRG